MIKEIHRYCTRCSQELAFNQQFGFYCSNKNCPLYTVYQGGVDNPKDIIQNPDVPIIGGGK